MSARGTIVALLACATTACGTSRVEPRQAEVARAGSEVMPFDLNVTTHIFEKTDTGGLQTVIADTDDLKQVALIRTHLAEEAERFSQGDFHDPAMVHGPDMAGLHTLVMGYERLTVAYREVERGAEITYESSDPALVVAVHQWFDAQLLDHGPHAQPHR